jgi:hypothetical protein
MSRWAKRSRCTGRSLRGFWGFGLVIALATLSTAGCGDRRLRSEARAFLARYEVLDHREKAALREQKVHALEQLVLTEPEVVAARTHCVEGHTALLSSERTQEHAAQELDRAVAGSPEGAPLSAQATEQIRLEIEQADNALANARENLRQCESQARGLSLRFGKP